jgi:hypothetical protein
MLMGDLRKIFKLELVTRGTKQGRAWQVYSRSADGNNWVVRFPVSTFDHYIGAYGLSDDITTLIDWAMHIPHIQDWTDPVYFEQDAAWRAGMITTLPIDVPGVIAGNKMPVHLYNADTIEEARRAHMLRVASVKSRVEYDVAGGRSILDRIYQIPHIDSFGVGKHRELTREFRLALQGHTGYRPKPEKQYEEDPAPYQRRAEAVKKDFADITLKFNRNRVIL